MQMFDRLWFGGGRVRVNSLPPASSRLSAIARHFAHAPSIHRHGVISPAPPRRSSWSTGRGTIPSQFDVIRDSAPAEEILSTNHWN
jgi:hypothetical protein